MSSFLFKPIKAINLLPHQTDAVKWMHARESTTELGISGGILSDHMGLGKTFSIMGCINYSSKVGASSNNLIIVPLAMIGTWVNTFKEYNFSVYSLTASGWHRHSYGKHSVFVVHYHAIIKHLSTFTGIVWTRVIIDEAHNIRNNKSIVFQNLMNIKSKHRWIVTATPLINGIKDLINLFTWLGYEHAGSLMGFADLYKKTLFQQFVLRRTIDDIPSLEGSIASASVKEIVVPMNDIEIDMFNSILETSDLSVNMTSVVTGEDVDEEDLVDEVQSGKIKNTALKAIHLLHLLSVSPSLINPMVHWSEGSKFRKLTGLLEGFRDDRKSTIVFCQFRKEIDLLLGGLVEAGVVARNRIFVLDGSVAVAERERILAEMKNRVEAGEHVVLLLQLKSGACGLNLQYFGAVVFINKWWNQPIIDQAIGRVVRIGSEGVKEIVFLRADLGYDNLLNAVLVRKAALGL
jgi:SNF2 family DNA or RNA helicase